VVILLGHLSGDEQVIGKTFGLDSTITSDATLNTLTATDLSQSTSQTRSARGSQACLNLELFNAAEVSLGGTAVLLSLLGLLDTSLLLVLENGLSLLNEELLKILHSVLLEGLEGLIVTILPIVVEHCEHRQHGEDPPAWDEHRADAQLPLSEALCPQSLLIALVLGDLGVEGLLKKEEAALKAADR